MEKGLLIRQGFIMGYVAFAVLLVCPLVTTSQYVLDQKHCDCTTTVLEDADSRGLKGRCSCPEYGILPKGIFENILDLELDYYQRVILRPGNFQKFHRIMILNISGVQFIEPGGFQGLETLERLFLYDNYMRVWESNMFTNLGRLVELTVKGTPGHKIHALENGTFSNLTKLERLNLKANAITDIDKEHFLDLENLGHLYLSHNKLTHIKANTFIHMSLLTQLDLSYNSIADINRHAFVGLTKLKNLILDGNIIKGIPKPIFMLGSLESSVDSNAGHITISLDKNPLRCDCHLNWISSWLDNGQECEGSCLAPLKFEYKSLHYAYKSSLSICQQNNTVLSVEPGKQLQLTCSFAGASWMTPHGRLLQEHGDCEDPFYLTNSDSLVIWKTSPDHSGNYSCLSSDGTQEYLYHVVVKESGPSFIVAKWVGIGGGGFVVGLLLMSVVCLIKQKSCRQRTQQTNPSHEDDIHEDDRQPLVEVPPEGDQQGAPAAVQEEDPPARSLNSDAKYKNSSVKKNLNVFPSGSV